MARGVGVNPPAAVFVAALERLRAEPEDVRMSLLEVGHGEVEMGLLRVRGIRPPRRAMVVGALEREDEAHAGVQRRVKRLLGREQLTAALSEL
jgi:hypothetical protein